MSLLALLAVTAATVALPPGYVPDAECAPCHKEIAKTFAHVGMARSFYRPRPETAIEDFTKLPFKHAASGDVMELRWRDGHLVFRRWTGNGENLFEQTVDWVLGSGDHARTYLYQTPNGELYQLPIAWYSHDGSSGSSGSSVPRHGTSEELRGSRGTGGWGMAPGYDKPNHEGVLRRARLECLFCHDAYPALATNSRDGYWRDQGVPAALPEGIGCQRCHGPGEEHVRRALGDLPGIRTSIVNPAKLAPQRRNDVCYECHMQPTVVVPGIRRFGRDINSFRPGDALSDYLLRVDIVDPSLPAPQRFEINHHPYRLEQSRCFRESAGNLSCLSCHDPHRQPLDVRHVCLGCHVKAHRANEDCVACHMPKRRTQDVVHAVMTDHRIGVYPDRAALVAPLGEREPRVADIRADDELYRVVAAVRVGSTVAIPKLEQLLAAKPSPDIEPYIDLGAAQLRQKRWADVEKTAKLILSRTPDDVFGLELLGRARFGLGLEDEGIAMLKRAEALDPQRAETPYELGLLLARHGDKAAARAAFQRAVALRPNMVLAWLQLGDVRRARAIEPRVTSVIPSVAKDPGEAGGRH